MLGNVIKLKQLDRKQQIVISKTSNNQQKGKNAYIKHKYAQKVINHSKK